MKQILTEEFGVEVTLND